MTPVIVPIDQSKRGTSLLKQKQTELIIESAKQILYNSCAQAIIKIISTPNILIKICLFIFVITTSSLASYFVIQSIITYFDYGVSVLTQTITESPAIFPKITLCNQNPFTSEFAVEYLESINRIVWPSVNIFDPNQISSLSFRNKSNAIGAIQIAAFENMNEDSYENQIKLAHSFDDILVSCYFNSNQLFA